MEHTIKVNYIVEVEDKTFQHVLGEAKQQGYDYSDSGPIETVKRFLIGEGVENVFPEHCVDRNTITIVTTQDEKT